jgi:hypothetical protein
LLYDPATAQAQGVTTIAPPDPDAPELRPTPTGWIAVANDFPRIAVTAPTEEDAERQYRESRRAWRALSSEQGSA